MTEGHPPTDTSTAAPASSPADDSDDRAELVRRVNRAETAALGAVTVLWPLVAAVNDLVKPDGGDSAAYGEAVERMCIAYDDALAWVRQEVDRGRIGGGGKPGGSDGGSASQSGASDA